MKLRNKKTGMIGEVGYISTSDGTIIVNNIEDQDELYGYGSLEELNEEWEDYKENPKAGYIIDPLDEKYLSKDDDCYDKYDVERAKKLGLWFETKEETELAIRKLEALKRLEEKGFRFNGYDVAEPVGDGEFCGQVFFRGGNYSRDEIKADLNTIFGGEK